MPIRLPGRAAILGPRWDRWASAEVAPASRAAGTFSAGPDGLEVLGSLQPETRRAGAGAHRALAPPAPPERRAARRSRFVVGTRARSRRSLKRYQPRLLAFCRHMLGSNEDAEDVLQEVFASAYRAICADERPIMRAAMALPDRAQPLPQPPAAAARRGPGVDGRLRARGRRDRRRHRPSPRGVPPDHRRRPRASRDPAHRPPPARDRHALLRPDRGRDGDHRCERQVAAGAGARCRSPRRPRRASSPAPRFGCSSAQAAEGIAQADPGHPPSRPVVPAVPGLQARASPDEPRARVGVPGRARCLPSRRSPAAAGRARPRPARVRRAAPTRRRAAPRRRAAGSTVAGGAALGGGGTAGCCRRSAGRSWPRPRPGWSPPRS